MNREKPSLMAEIYDELNAENTIRYLLRKHGKNRGIKLSLEYIDQGLLGDKTNALFAHMKSCASHNHMM